MPFFLIQCLVCGIASASVLSNAEITINVRDSNGAIGSTSLNGVEFFMDGYFAGDWGIQVAGDPSTFAINKADGSGGIAATVVASSDSVVVNAVYAGGGNDIGITRTYSFLSGSNVLRIESTLINNGDNFASLKYFDSFHPESVDIGNYMDRYTLAGVEVAAAISESGPTIILANPTGFTALAAGSPFSIGDGTALNNFFAAPFDGNGSHYYDEAGLHGAMEVSLAAGAAYTTTYLLSFGTHSADVQADLVASLASVPEPSMSLLGLLGVISLMTRRRNAK